MWRYVINGTLLLVSSATVRQSSAPAPSSGQTEADARVFMKEYEDDLRAHRREALAARYSRTLPRRSPR